MPASALSNPHRIAILKADAELAAAVPAEERDAALRFIVGDASEHAPGPWTPDVARQDGGEGFALMIVRGLVLREVARAGRRAGQVYGPGDVVRAPECADSSLSESVTWTVMDSAMVVVL